MLIFKSIIKTLAIILPILISVAYLTLLERKVMASMQRRRGPNTVGVFGLLQPFADGLKLMIKEILFPIKANKILFIIAPVIFLALALINWAIIPFQINSVLADLNLGILFILAISSLSVYGLILSGWASNSQHAFLGALRSTAQMISYEISLALIILSTVALTNSLNLSIIALSQTSIWLVIPLLPAFTMFLVSALAETSRPPFDLPEAEAELVSGYNVEYSSMGFAFFFIAEYTNIIFMSFLITILFLGAWYPVVDISLFLFISPTIWLSLKSLFIIFTFIWVRAAFPRYRYDQLMSLTWRIFLPLSVALVVFVFGVALLITPKLYVSLLLPIFGLIEKKNIRHYSTKSKDEEDLLEIFPPDLKNNSMASVKPTEETATGAAPALSEADINVENDEELPINLVAKQVAEVSVTQESEKSITLTESLENIDNDIESFANETDGQIDDEIEIDADDAMFFEDLAKLQLKKFDKIRGQAKASKKARKTANEDQDELALGSKVKKKKITPADKKKDMTPSSKNSKIDDKPNNIIPEMARHASEKVNAPFEANGLNGLRKKKKK